MHSEWSMKKAESVAIPVQQAWIAAVFFIMAREYVDYKKTKVYINNKRLYKSL